VIRWRGAYPVTPNSTASASSSSARQPRRDAAFLVLLMVESSDVPSPSTRSRRSSR
jgi:hypothetical protein